MSAVHLHIGQCGNQLSVPLWQNFIRSSGKGTEQVFASLDGWHRSVHIDSEHKVTASLPEKFHIREKNVVVGKRGRGTNFALGYSGMASVGDDHVLDSAMEAVRKETERCDIFSGIIVYHSISGGTGSGLGARMIEMLRDSYPCNYIISCAVAPCVSGESPLQNYNALLALHWLQTYSDCIILLQNDFYLSRLHCPEETRKQISFKDLNSLIANNLCGVFLPTSTLSLSRNVSIGQEPWELVRTLTPMPSTKFINLSQHISSKSSWEEMTSKVLSFYPKYNAEGVQNHCLSGTAVARGDKDNIFLSAVNKGIDQKVKKGVGVVGWNPYPFDWWRALVNTLGTKKNCSMTLATNSTCIVDHLNVVQARSQVKLESGAYLHWYDRYGISQLMKILERANIKSFDIQASLQYCSIVKVSSLIWIPVTTQLENTTVFTYDKSSTTVLIDDGSNTTVLTEDELNTTVLNTTVFTYDKSSTTVLIDDGSNTTVLTEDELNTTVLNTTVFTYDKSNTTVLMDDGSNITVLTEDELNTTVLNADMSNTTVLKVDILNTTILADNGSDTSIFTDNGPNSTVLTDDGSTNTTVLEEIEYSTTSASSASSQSSKSNTTVLIDDGSNTTVLTEDELNTTVLNTTVFTYDKSNTTVLIDDGSNTTVLIEDGSNTTVLIDDGSNTTVLTEDELNTTVLNIAVFTYDKSNTTVLIDDGSNITVLTEDELNTTVLNADMSNTTVLKVDILNTTVLTDNGSDTSIFTDNGPNSTVLTDDGSTNTTVPEEIEYSTTTSASSASSQSSVSKTDHTVDCTKYAAQSTAKPAVHLKVEPMCTESGSIMDQLIRFIGYQFHKHKCGNPSSTANFTEILYCSMLNTHTMCMQPFVDEQKNINTETVPQISTVRNMIEGLCSMDRFIAKDCLFKRLKYVTRCVKTEVDSILSFQNKRWAYGAIDQCRHLEVKVMCMWENVLPCNARTAGSMAGLIGQHLRSETCTLSGAQHVLPFTWFQLTAISFTHILLFVMGHT